MSTYSDYLLTLDPIGYWSLGELSGTVCNDSGPNNLDGTYNVDVASPPALETTGGYAGAITGGDTAVAMRQSQFVDLGAPAALHIAAPVSVSLWVRRLAGEPLQVSAFFTEDFSEGSNIRYVLGVHDPTANTAFFGFYTGGWKRVIDTAVIPDDEAWHNLVGTYDGANLKIYRDGVLTNTLAETTALPAAAGNFYIGRRWDSTDQAKTVVDEVAVFPTALTLTQIETLYDAASGIEPPVPPPPPETQSKLSVGDIGPPGGLTVRLKTDLTDVHVTKDIRSLRFSNGVPGGFKTLELTLDRPLALSPQEIRLYGDCYVYSGRSGAIVWQGRLEDPGRGSTNDGQIWTVRAVGHYAHASDITRPLVYVNRSLEPFYVSASTDKKFQMSRQDESEQNGALRISAPRNTVLAANDIAAWRCDIFRESGMKLARIRMSAIGGAGFGDDNRIQIVTFVGGTGDEAKDAAWSDTEQSLTALVVTDFDNEDDAFQVRYKRVDTGATIGSDAFWHLFYTVIARSLLVDATGTEITTGYTLNTVLAHEIVKDLIGRLCTDWDGAHASIDTSSTYAIEQLAYLDGTNAAQVAADLALFESKYWLAVWEEKTVAGKAVPYWAQWPTTVRYEATTRDGFDSPGSSLELFDAVTVRWRDERGQIRRTRRTQTVTVLTDAGLSREAFIDLGDELASLANAQRVGDQFLLDHAAPPNAGTLTIRRPIVDRIVGGRVQPWEIRAGNLIRVRDVLPSADALNVSDRDAVTVFRVVEVDYESATNTATLQLDSQARTLSKLVNRRSQTRRR